MLEPAVPLQHVHPVYEPPAAVPEAARATEPREGPPRIPPARTPPRPAPDTGSAFQGSLPLQEAGWRFPPLSLPHPPPQAVSGPTYEALEGNARLLLLYWAITA